MAKAPCVRCQQPVPAKCYKEIRVFGVETNYHCYDVTGIPAWARVDASSTRLWQLFGPCNAVQLAVSICLYAHHELPVREGNRRSASEVNKVKLCAEKGLKKRTQFWYRSAYQ